MEPLMALLPPHGDIFIKCPAGAELQRRSVSIFKVSDQYRWGLEHNDRLMLVLGPFQGPFFHRIVKDILPKGSWSMTVEGLQRTF
jgi:hypothetical protein